MAPSIVRVEKSNNKETAGRSKCPSILLLLMPQADGDQFGGGGAEMTVSCEANVALKRKGQVVIAGRLIETNRGEGPRFPRR